MTTLEHRELRGITYRNLIVSVISLISVVTSVVGIYYSIKGEMAIMRAEQASQIKINDLRIKALETSFDILKHDVAEMKKDQK